MSTEPPKDKTRHYAIWKYDIFPYLLAGEITKFHNDEFVSIKGYEGYKYKPIKIVWGESGLRLVNRIKDLGTEYNVALKILNNNFREKVHQATGIEVP